MGMKLVMEAGLGLGLVNPNLGKPLQYGCKLGTRIHVEEYGKGVMETHESHLEKHQHSEF